jgi:hypothetical protein
MPVQEQYSDAHDTFSRNPLPSPPRMGTTLATIERSRIPQCPGLGCPANGVVHRASPGRARTRSSGEYCHGLGQLCAVQHRVAFQGLASAEHSNNSGQN